MIYGEHEFLETMQLHWGFLYYGKLFLTLIFCTTVTKRLEINNCKFD